MKCTKPYVQVIADFTVAFLYAIFFLVLMKLKELQDDGKLINENLTKFMVFFSNDVKFCIGIHFLKPFTGLILYPCYGVSLTSSFFTLKVFAIRLF